MRGTLNAHRLFIGGKGRPGYLDNLEVSDQKEQALRRARDLVRQALRDGMPLQRQRLAQDGFIDRAMLAEGREIPLKPKFRMQGSAVYRTLNDPAHTPPQEIDYDDGVFLPTSFLARTNRPALAAKGYFKAVEGALETLCKQEGWELDTSKDCCVRIRGVAIDAHIDIRSMRSPMMTSPNLLKPPKKKSGKALQRTASLMKPHLLNRCSSSCVPITSCSRRAMLAGESPTLVRLKIGFWRQSGIMERGCATFAVT